MALDVLEGAATVLVLEGDADVVDAALEGEIGTVERITQAKTKKEPYVWTPQEIADVLSDWLDTGPAPMARFDFVTDGSLGPSAVAKLAPALASVADGTVATGEQEYLSGLGLDPSDSALGRVTLHSRLPDGRSLLEAATLRVLELRERVDPVTVEEARDVVWRLFGQTVLGSGDDDPAARRLDREQIGGIVGVRPSAIDDAEPWSAALEAEYRGVIAAVRPDPAWTLLDLLAAERPPVLSFVTARTPAESGPSRPEPATVLLDREDSVLLQGPAGTGKTTTLAQLRSEALDRGLLPLYLRVGSYVAGSLEQLLRRSIERAVEHPLVPRVVDELLDRSDTVVFVDGAGELVPEQRQALVADLAGLRDRHPRARFLLAAREAAPFGRSRLSGFVLRGLSHESRREIARSLTDAGDDLVVDEIEERLGDVVDNPLLFTMAVGLYARGVRASTRVELFDGFTGGLEAREEGVRLSVAARSAAAAACFDLRREGRYSADEWWWLERFAEARDHLVATGTLSTQAPAAEELLAAVRGLGVIQAVGDGSELGLLHDLFCDWLASEAVRHGMRQLPDPVTESLEEAAVFLAERGEPDADQLLAIAGNACAAVRVADVMPAGTVDPELADAIWERLRDQLAPDLRTRFEGYVLDVREGDPPWICLVLDDSDDVVDPAQLASTSPLTCLAVGMVSSLSVAVDLWLGVLRLGMRDDAPQMPQRPPRDDQDLARLLEEAVLRQREVVEVLVERLVPTLFPRIVQIIGSLGLRGWLLPGQPTAGVPGSGQTIVEHVLHYTPTADGAHIDVVDSADEIPADASAGQMSAEMFLHGSSQSAGRKKVEDALAELMPRYDA